MPAGQLWGTTTLGGFTSIGTLSQKLRHFAQPMMKGDQFARVEPAAGKHKGSTIYFDKVANVATAGTALNETQPVPITNVTIAQGSVVMTEYGNGVAFTGKLEALSEFTMEQLILKPLRNDAAKTLNTRAITEFKATYLQYTPTGTATVPTGTFDTDGTISTAATRDIQSFDVYEIVEYLKGTTLTPPWDGQNYMAIAHASFLRKMREDGDWQAAAQYGDPERLFSGEIGRFNGVRFVEDNHAMNSLIGTSAFKGEALFFGEDAVMKAVAVPLEIREKVPGDFGRDQAMAWYALQEYKIVWDLTAAAGQVRILRINAT